MKSAWLTGSKQFVLRGDPEPIAPPGGLVVKVEACGVCGSDLRRWKEGPPPGVEGIVPGHEAAGTVVEIHEETTGFQAGDRLAIAPDVHCGCCYYCRRGLFNLCDDLKFVGITPRYPGAFAEKLVLTREILTNGIVHKIPGGMPAAIAALAEPCCSVLACHQQAGTSLHDTVVILGAGPIGCLHAAIARIRGARTIVSEPSLNRRRMCERFDPDAILNPLEEEIAVRVRELTGGLGADIAICANPIAETQSQAVHMVRKGGRVVLFGGLPKANPLTTLDSNRIHYGEITVAGSFSYHPSVHALALDLLNRNVIPADKIITHTFPLESIGDAFTTAASGDALKAIVSL